ncbi:PIG-L family deacetylase [Aeromonas veronii]|uniref:PIG-L family deacetylase n=1 Tax=Aeromonas veronii TaxID=654 RepID=UPI00191DDF39|nr:PIG-L family deacetylase [Aeromonas veronii]MBL0446167.1 PIG-L family deacetylase [Aeromonas veronii]
MSHKSDVQLSQMNGSYILDSSSVNIINNGSSFFIIFNVIEHSFFSQSRISLCYENEREVFSLCKNEKYAAIPVNKPLCDLKKIEVSGLKINNRCSLFVQSDIGCDEKSIVISPHPDDAELSSFLYYAKRNNTTYIVNVTAGEYLMRLKSQYIDGLSDDLTEAVSLKGMIRLWNGLHIPALAGIASSQILSLGYQDGKIELSIKKSLPPISEYRYATDNLVKYNFDDQVSLVGDLSLLMNKLKPTVVIVPNPFIDTHSDHVASAWAIAKAMEASGFYPEKILLYAIHEKGYKNRVVNSYEHCRYISGEDLDIMRKVFLGGFSIYSECSSERLHKMKVIALDAMHDLRHKDRFLKAIKKKIKKALFIRREDKQHPHELVNSFGKRNEVFIVVDGVSFCSTLNGVIHE